MPEVAASDAVLTGPDGSDSAQAAPPGTSASGGMECPGRHTAGDLIALFDRCFHASHGTRLVRGGREPLYLPRGQDCPYDRVIFAHGFFASALHEVAHWCIAGPERRRRVDYGYWYCPDGRDAAAQRAFERVEARPQALEWIFSVTAGFRFRLSNDNLCGEAVDPESFRRAVWEQAQHCCRTGLPPRAACFRRVLAQYYGTDAENPPVAAQFPLEALR